MKADDVLRYGTIITDDKLRDEMNGHVRINIMSYEQAIYYVKMTNGEVVELKKVGFVEQ